MFLVTFDQRTAAAACLSHQVRGKSNLLQPRLEKAEDKQFHIKGYVEREWAIYSDLNGEAGHTDLYFFFFSHILWQPSPVSLLSFRKNMSQTHRHPFKKFELIAGAAVIRYYANARN